MAGVKSQPGSTPGPVATEEAADNPNTPAGAGGDSCETGSKAEVEEDCSDAGNTERNVRKKGIPWTEDEHRLFLLGLQKLGKGDWRGISRHYVTTRTPTQVASHAQKHFIRQQTLSKRKRRSSLFDIVNEGTTQENGGASGSSTAVAGSSNMPLPPYPAAMPQQGVSFMPGAGMAGLPGYGFGNPVHMQQQQAAAAHAAAAAGWNPAMGQAAFMAPHAAHQFSGYLQMAHQHQQNFAQQQAAAAGMFFAHQQHQQVQHQQQQAAAYAAWMQQMQHPHPSFGFPPAAMMGMLPPYQQHRFSQPPRAAGSGPAALPSVPSMPSIPSTPRLASDAVDGAQGQPVGVSQAVGASAKAHSAPAPTPEPTVGAPGTGGSAFSPAVPSAHAQKSGNQGSGANQSGNGNSNASGIMKVRPIGSVHSSIHNSNAGSVQGSNPGVSGSGEWTVAQLGMSPRGLPDAPTAGGSGSMDVEHAGPTGVSPPLQPGGDFGHGKLFRPTASRAQPAQTLSSLPLFGAGDGKPVAPHNAPHGVKRQHSSDDASSGGDGSGGSGSGMGGSGRDGSSDGATKNSDKSSGKSSGGHWQLPNGSDAKGGLQLQALHTDPKPPNFRNTQGCLADAATPSAASPERISELHADGGGAHFRAPAKSMKMGSRQ